MEVDVVRERRRRVVQTVLWFCLTLLLALFIPDIGRVISLIGGLAACFIFVFPGTWAPFPLFLFLHVVYNSSSYLTPDGAIVCDR